MSLESSGPIAAPAPGQLDQPGSAALDNSPVVYGLGFFGLTSTAQVLAGYFLFFYVDVLGLAVALAAFVNVVYAIWDAVNDPLVGYLSDNTRSRWGRRRPWLLAGLPFYLFLFVLIYAVPGVFRQGNALFWYVLIVIFSWETAATVINMNYQALFPELFQGFKIRTRASAYSQGLASAGELVGFALTPIVYTAFGFEGMAVLFAGLASNLSVALVASVIAGAGLGGVKVCREMILATLVDRSLARTGRRQEGVYYSLSRFFGRLSKLLEALALILLGLLFGYVSGEDPGPNPASAFRFLMSVLPFICMVAALLLARTLRLEEDKSFAQA